MRTKQTNHTDKAAGKGNRSANRGKRGPAPRVPADQLLRERKAIGATQEQVAKVLEIGSSSIYRYESKGGPSWYLYALKGIRAELGARKR